VVEAEFSCAERTANESSGKVLGGLIPTFIIIYFLKESRAQWTKPCNGKHRESMVGYVLNLFREDGKLCWSGESPSAEQLGAMRVLSCKLEIASPN